MDNEGEIQGVKFSEFSSASPGQSDEVVGLHSGSNARFGVASLIYVIRQGLANVFVPITRKINNKLLSSDINLTASDVGARPGTWMPSAADVGAQEEITASGILKGNGAGNVSAAVPGTDYQTPLTAGTDYATPAQLATKAPFSAGIFPGTSSTAGGTQAKVGTVPDLSGLTALYDGLTICMTFANAQTYDGQPTLDIGIPYNGVTAFGINRTSASAAGIYDWGTGSAVDLVFDATNAVWIIKKGQHGSALRYGVLLLSDSVSENSTVGGGKAATPAAVKTAYDLAASKSKLLRFTAQAVSVASGAEIFRITDSDITTDTEVVSVEFADPSYIPSGGSWTSYAGYVAFTGTCTAATTADVILKI